MGCEKLQQTPWNLHMKGNEFQKDYPPWNQQVAPENRPPEVWSFLFFQSPFLGEKMLVSGSVLSYFSTPEN